jgi:hypothetical protein
VMSTSLHFFLVVFGNDGVEVLIWAVHLIQHHVALRGKTIDQCTLLKFIVVKLLGVAG